MVWAWQPRCFVGCFSANVTIIARFQPPARCEAQPAVSTLAVRGLMLISVSGLATGTEKQRALEEASKGDSTAAGEARQRSKPRPTIAGLEGRAAHRAVLERHARQHRASRSTSGHEAIPCRPQSQAGAGVDYARHGPAMDGRQEDVTASSPAR